MTLDEMYRKHQQTWLLIFQQQKNTSKLITKENANIPHREEMERQFNNCYACQYALEDAFNARIDKDIYPIIEEFMGDCTPTQICKHCPLDFESPCFYKSSLYHRFYKSTDHIERALLALKILTTPIKEEVIVNDIRRDV